MTTFQRMLQDWVDAACEEWGYPAATIDQLAGVDERLPTGLQELIAKGHEDGLITSSGLRFTLLGLPAGKGPYAWLSRDKRQVPAVNWEYLVQAAEYVRMHQQLSSLGYRVLVEDRLMDITVERDGELLWYVEVKEKADDLPAFAVAIAAYGTAGVDLDLRPGERRSAEGQVHRALPTPVSDAHGNRHEPALPRRLRYRGDLQACSGHGAAAINRGQQRPRHVDLKGAAAVVVAA